MAGAVSESPPALVAHRIDHGHTDGVLETFELAQNDRAMRPRACERNIEMVTATLRRIWRRAIAFHPIAKRVLLAFEGAGLGLFFRKLGHAIRNE